MGVTDAVIGKMVVILWVRARGLSWTTAREVAEKIVVPGQMVPATLEEMEEAINAVLRRVE